MVEHSFFDLRQTMSMTLALVVLDFTKPFVLQSDALGLGLGVILTQ